MAILAGLGFNCSLCVNLSVFDGRFLCTHLIPSLRIRRPDPLFSASSSRHQRDKTDEMSEDMKDKTQTPSTTIFLDTLRYTTATQWQHEIRTFVITPTNSIKRKHHVQKIWAEAGTHAMTSRQTVQSVEGQTTITRLYVSSAGKTCSRTCL